MSDLYEFKMYFFNHGKPKEFLFFIRNFKMTLAETGTLDMDANIQYLLMLVSGGAFCQIDSLSDDVEIQKP